MVVLSSSDTSVASECHEVTVGRHVQSHYEFRTTVRVDVRATGSDPRVVMVWPFPNPDHAYNSQQYEGPHVYGNYDDLVLAATVETCDASAGQWLERRYATEYGFAMATLVGAGVHEVQWRWCGDLAFAAVAAMDQPTATPTVKTVTVHHGDTIRWVGQAGGPPQQRRLDTAPASNLLANHAVQCRVVKADCDVESIIIPADARSRTPSPLATNCGIS